MNSVIDVAWKLRKLDGSVEKISFPENGMIDLAAIPGAVPLGSERVVLTGVCTPEKPVTAVCGIAADGAWIFKVNGNILFDASATGNSENPVRPDNHPFEVDLNAGKNVFELEILGKDHPVQTLFTAFRQLPDRGKLEFKYQPVVLFPDAEEKAVSIVFASSVPSPAAVDFRKSGDSEWQRLYDNLAGQIRRDLSTHHIRLDNLFSGAVYEYRAVLVDDLRLMKDAAFSETGTFRVPEKSGNFSFAVTSDLQDRICRLKYLEQLFASDIIRNTQFFTYLGDVFWTTDFDHTVMDGFIMPFRRMSSNSLPLVMVRGNHEIYGRESLKYLDYFSMPSPGRDGYGMFRIGEVCFIVLDFCDDAPNVAQPSTRCFHDFEPYLAAQSRWLRRAVASPACREAKFRIVLAHGTPLGDSKEYLPGHVRQIIDPVFGGAEPQVKIHLYLGGHIHRPFRSIPYREACYSVFDPKALATPHPKLGSKYGFTVVTTGGPSKIITVPETQATSIRVDLLADRIDVTSFDLNLEEYDRFSVDENGSVFNEKRRSDFRFFEY